MSKPLRWGIVGCGAITENRVAPAINAHPQSKLVAFCSGARGRAEDYARRHGAERGTDDLAAFVRSDLDCVYVASKVCQHAEQTLAALEAGKHVLCEKPMAMNAAECRRMIEAAAAAGRKLGVAYYRRFYPVWVRAKELAASGALGEIAAVRIAHGSFWDLRSDDPRPWRVVRKLSGGGPLADVGSHRLDLLVDLLGLPKTVSALADCRRHDWDVEDAAALLMGMDGGAFATAQVLGDMRPPCDEFDIYGTEGSVSAPGLRVRIQIQADGKTWREDRPPHDNVHYPLIHDFVQAALADQAPRCDGEEGAKTTRIMDAAYASARDGKAVAP